MFRFCGGLLLDIKRKAPFFLSDFTDAIHIQALSAILFIYLGTVTNAITFGGLLGDATENMQVRSCSWIHAARFSPLTPSTTTQDTMHLSASTCRVCWRVSSARPSPAEFFACWPASRSPYSAAPVRFWSSNGCSSTSAGSLRRNWTKPCTLIVATGRV